MKKIPSAKQLKDEIATRVRRGQGTDDMDERIEQANGILEEFNIDLEVRVKEDVYTPEKVSNVLFNVSKPTGYKTDEVEKFVDDTEYSIAYYIEYIEDKNDDIHKLANEINQLRTQIENHRAQIALHRARGVAVVDENGEYVKEKVKSPQEQESNSEELHQLEEEVNNLNNQLEEKTQEYKELVSSYDELQSYVEQIEEYSASLETRIEELEAGVQVQEYDEEYANADDLEDFVDDSPQEYDEFTDETQEMELTTDVAALQQQIEEFNNWGDEMEQNLLQVTEAKELAEEELAQARAELEKYSEVGDIDGVQEEIATLTEQFNISEAEKTELYKQYEEVANTVTEQAEHISQMEEYATTLEEANSNLEEDNKEKDRIIKELQREIKTLKREHSPASRVELDSDRYGTHKPRAKEPVEEPRTAPTRARRQAPAPAPKPKAKRLSMEDIMSSELDD